MRQSLTVAVILNALLLGPSLAGAADRTPDCGGLGESKCEFKRAIHVSKAKKLGCPKGTFFDPIRGGECWSCSKGYVRTLTHVQNAKACAKNLIFGPWQKAKYHRSAWGCTNRKGEFLDPVDGGQCYKCPADYNRSIHHVKGPQACTVSAALRCDAGLKRQGDICIPPVDPAEKARVLKAYPADAEKNQHHHTNMARGLQSVANDGSTGDQNAQRRRLMENTLRRVEDEGFDTVTLLYSISAAVGVGYGHARGFAMTRGGECREAFGNTFTAGVSLGVSAVEEIGMWKGTIDDLAGETNGVQASGGLLVLTFTEGIHWSPGVKEYTGITTGKGAAGGLGIDLGIEYVHGWTKLRCEVDCATLDWDDIPLLDSAASCNQ